MVKRMYVGDSIPIRVRKSAMPTLRRLKAQLMLKEGRRVSDADVVSRALELALRATEDRESRGKRLLDYAGCIKGGPRSNSAVDADEFIYGDDA